MNVIEIEENVSAICSEFDMIENKDFQFFKNFYKNGDFNDPKSYWSIEIKTSYIEDLEVLVLDSGFRLKEYYSKSRDRGNMKCINIDVKKQKVHYIMILPVTICPPPDMTLWL